jgi:hypothetical protein
MAHAFGGVEGMIDMIGEDGFLQHPIGLRGAEHRGDQKQ